MEQALIDENKAFEKRNAELAIELAQIEGRWKVISEQNFSIGTSNVWASLNTLYAEPNKTKYTFAAIEGLKLAKKALPTPKAEDYEKALSSQQDLISDLADEIARGKKKIAEQEKAIDEANKEQAKLQEEKKKVETEKTNLENAHNVKVFELKDEALKEKNTALLQKQKEIDEKDAKDKSELQKLIVKILMVVGVVAGIVAFVVKGPGQLINPLAAIASASAIGLAVGVSFLPTWMLIVALSVVFMLVIGTILYEVKRYRDIAKVGVGAIQERKNENPDEHKNLAPILKSWTGGNQTLEKNIDKLAEELNTK